MAKKKKMSKEERERYDALVMQMKQYEKPQRAGNVRRRDRRCMCSAGARHVYGRLYLDCGRPPLGNTL